jgi:hypothetical protein
MIQTLRIYGRCAAKIPGALARSPWVVVVPLVFSTVLTFAATAVAPLGIVGGFIMGLITTAVAASGLYVIAELLGGRPVKPNDLITGLRNYFWPVMNVGFVAWMASIVIGLATQNMQNGAALSIALWGVAFVLLNATPETIYLRGVYGGMDVLSTAFGFMQEHWLEWLLPNIVFGALYLFVLPLVMELLPAGIVGTILGAVVQGIVILPILLFRGFLFEALDGRRRSPFTWAARG